MDRHIWGWDGRMGLGGHTWGGNAWIWGVGVEARGIGMDGYVGLGWMDTWGWDGHTWAWMDKHGIGWTQMGLGGTLMGVRWTRGVGMNVHGVRMDA